MSEMYVRRLRSVRAEFDAARQALIYVERHWQRQAIHQEVERITPRDLAQAGQNVEPTYIIRLFAEFEGVLKDHLETNHPRVTVPARPRIDWLIQQVMRVEALSLDASLRRKVDAVRDYRNSIAHHKRPLAPAITLAAALAILNRFVARLPEPLR